MKILRIGLILLIAFGVLSLGAVDVWSQSAIEIGAALLLVWWAAVGWVRPETEVRWNPLNWPLLGFIAIAGLQLLFRGTASAFLTRSELLRLSAYFVIFFLIVQAFRTRQDWLRLAWFVVLFGFGVSLFGIAQHFTSNYEIYWMHSLKTDVQPFGPYVNRNDFAGFVELTLPIGLALLIFRGVHKDIFPMLIVLTVIPVSAAVLSTSRAGVSGVALEIGVLLFLAARRRGLSRKRHTSRNLALGLAAVAAMALVAWLGIGRTVERFSQLSHPEITMSRRISMARGAVDIFLAHPLKGCGLGAIVDVFPRYETAYDGKVVDHVHDDYLEALAEAGILGAICGLSFLWLLYRGARKNLEAEQGHFSYALHAGGIAAVCGLLLHSFVDFNLHIPGNAILFLLEVSIATCPPIPPASRMRVPRAVPGAERAGQSVPVPQ
ncbi:MAG TPA: O-antigen ligase family protein [Candidatus Dormibacteraeota bacterium]|nr:O-antigen ligase family protein [Candidatus Dormibacteraeota bacterium]